jgi:predicted O-methyltransferase YrrM
MLTLDGAKPPRKRGRFRRVFGFVKPYFIGLGYSMWLFTFGWMTRRGRGRIVEIAGRAGYNHVSRAKQKLAEVKVPAVIGDSREVRLASLESVDGNVTDRELVVLNGIVRASRAKSIFEFGTFDGRTTRNLAANVPADGNVWTIDLPQSSMSGLAVPIDRQEQKYVAKLRSGDRYRGTPEERRIVQLFGDSGTYDFSKLFGSFDFVFVDASHAYQYVINDSLLALQLLGPRGGTIAWHDYGRWDGVTRALNDLQRRHPDFRDLVKVEGTTLAVLRVGVPRSIASKTSRPAWWQQSAEFPSQ